MYVISERFTLCAVRCGIKFANIMASCSISRNRVGSYRTCCIDFWLSLECLAEYRSLSVES